MNVRDTPSAVRDTPSAVAVVHDTPSSVPVVHDVRGHIDIAMGSMRFTVDRRPGGPCTAVGVYSDVHDGGQLSVLDQNGKILALGTIGAGNTQWGNSVDTGAYAALCAFPFLIPKVGQAQIYQLKVGDAVVRSYTYQDLQISNWTMDLHTK